MFCLSQDLFLFEISSVTELVLGGNANYPVKRLQWKTVTGIAAHVLTTLQYPHFVCSLLYHY